MKFIHEMLFVAIPCTSQPMAQLLDSGQIPLEEQAVELSRVP
jgi:hypothetical protein